MSSFTKFLLVFNFITIFMFDITGQNVQLVKDIRTIANHPQNPDFSSHPDDLVSFNGYLYFTALDNTHGRELWRSDGTEAGTTMFMDINNIGDSGSNPENLTVIGNYLYFTANDGTFGDELWRTDGTLAGTNILKDINTTNNGLASSYPYLIIPIDNTSFYFFADTDIHGRELWKSNGTAAGTVLVMDYNVGTPEFSPTEALMISATLYFAAYDDITGELNLYQSDGTTVSRIFPNNSCLAGTNLSPRFLTNFNNDLYFSGSGVCNGIDTGPSLWRKLSNNSNAELVKDINETSSTSDVNSLITLNGTLYFIASNTQNNGSLWKSDGTTAGTVIVKNLPQTLNLTIYKNKLIFNASAPGFGNELWQSDGSTNGTILLKDIVPNSPSGYPELFRVVGNTLYFRALGSSSGSWELWKTDGTETGTILVQDINPGNAGSFPTNLTNVNGILYFVANDGVHADEVFRTLIPDCVQNNIATADATITSPIEVEYFYGSLSCQNLIARIRPQGATSPITGNVIAKVWQGGVGYPNNVASRHYEINPIDVSNGDGRITLYFSTEEIDDYNQDNSPNYQEIGDGLLPEGANDDYNQRKNVRILKYSGLSNNGTGIPASYSGTPTLIDPDDFDIIYNPSDSRWEITFNSIGSGGYFLQGVFTPDCSEPNKNYSKNTGNWNDPTTWVCNRIPLVTDVVIIRSNHIITVPINYQGVSNITYLEHGAILDLKPGASISIVKQ